MNTITEMSARSTNLLQTEALNLLKGLAAQHGMTLRAAGGTYDITKATLKFEFTITGEDAEKKQFEKDAPHIGCEAADYGKQAVINKELCTLVGFALSRRSFPVKVKKPSGDIVLLKEDVLAKYFKTGFEVRFAAQKPVIEFVPAPTKSATV